MSPGYKLRQTGPFAEITGFILRMNCGFYDVFAENIGYIYRMYCGE